MNLSQFVVPNVMETIEICEGLPGSVRFVTASCYRHSRAPFLMVDAVSHL